MAVLKRLNEFHYISFHLLKYIQMRPTSWRSHTNTKQTITTKQVQASVSQRARDLPNHSIADKKVVLLFYGFQSLFHRFSNQSNLFLRLVHINSLDPSCHQCF